LSSLDILAEILNLLCSKRVVTIEEVARKIGVSRTLVTQVIHVLLAEGVVTKVTTHGNACSNCPLRSTCSSYHPCGIDTYVLTARGLKMCAH